MPWATYDTDAPTTSLVIIAKEPIPGRAKTRLHPPLTLEEAAHVAAACIDDTIDAVADLPVRERILAFDGRNAPARAAGYRVLPQVEGTMDQRLGAIFDAATGPTLLIGMDTPQVSVADLAPAFFGWPDDIDAFVGLAADGGWWAFGLREPDGDLLRGVPTSREDTGRLQLQRLRDAGLRVGMLRTLTDIDEYADALAVGSLIPRSRVAGVLRATSLVEALR